MVALADTIGGRILLGVRDDGAMARVKDSNNLRARIQDLAGDCDPPLKVIDAGGHKALRVLAIANGERVYD